MDFKRVKCPVCEQKISSIWFYFWIPTMKHTCSNCKKRIKWHPIVKLHGLAFTICIIGGYNLFYNYIEPHFLAGIIGIIAGVVVCAHLPRKAKIIEKKWVRKRIEKIRKIGY